MPLTRPGDDLCHTRSGGVPENIPGASSSETEITLGYVRGGQSLAQTFRLTHRDLEGVAWNYIHRLCTIAHATHMIVGFSNCYADDTPIGRSAHLVTHHPITP